MLMFKYKCKQYTAKINIKLKTRVDAQAEKIKIKILRVSDVTWQHIKIRMLLL